MHLYQSRSLVKSYIAQCIKLGGQNLYEADNLAEQWESLNHLEKQPVLTQKATYAQELLNALEEANDIQAQASFGIIREDNFESVTEYANAYGRLTTTALETITTLENLGQHSSQDRQFFSTLKHALNQSLKIVENLQQVYNNPDSFFSRYKNQTILLMQQGLNPALGSAEGVCSGLTLNYFKHRTTGEGFSFNLNDALIQPEDAFQKRLMRAQYQPDLKKQISEIVAFTKAEPNANKHFKLSLRRDTTGGKHSVYLQYNQEEAKWHFFDPNHGAFEFEDENDFKEFYTNLYTRYHLFWHSYQFSELVSQKPKKTFQGKLTSLLTGASHNSTHNKSWWGTRLFIGATFVAISATVLLTAPISIPMIAVAGAVLALGGVGIYLANLSEKSQFNGLLALIHFPQYFLRDLFSSYPDDLNYDNLSQKPEEQSSSSFVDVLKGLPPSLSSRDLTLEDEEPLLRDSRENNRAQGTTDQKIHLDEILVADDPNATSTSECVI